MAEALSQRDIETFRESGFLVLERRVPDDVLLEIRGEIARFEDQARGMTASDDKIDLEDSHSPDAPRIRAVAVLKVNLVVRLSLIHI